MSIPDSLKEKFEVKIKPDNDKAAIDEKFKCPKCGTVGNCDGPGDQDAGKISNKIRLG